jgi:hypothetical protein
MKTRLVFPLAIALLAAPVWAQDFQSSRQSSGSQAQKNTGQAKPGQPLPPKASGVIIMMSEQGLQVINPLAPKELGVGKKLLTQGYTANPTQAGLNEDPKPFGGINIIGFEF